MSEKDFGARAESPRQEHAGGFEEQQGKNSQRSQIRMSERGREEEQRSSRDHITWGLCRLWQGLFQFPAEMGSRWSLLSRRVEELTQALKGTLCLLCSMPLTAWQQGQKQGDWLQAIAVIQTRDTSGLDQEGKWTQRKWSDFEYILI